MADTTSSMTTPVDQQRAVLQAQGIPDEIIDQLLNLGLQDPTGLGKQYDMSAYLRKGALASDSSKGLAGVLAQGLMGAGAAKSDRTYSDLLRGRNQATVDARRGYFNQRFPKKPSGQITDQPYQYAPGEGGNEDFSYGP